MHSQIWLSPLVHDGEPTNLTNLGKKTLVRMRHCPCQRVYFAIPCCAAQLPSFAISIAAKKMDDL
jgi:hypothetical protein